MTNRNITRRYVWSQIPYLSLCLSLFISFNPRVLFADDNEAKSVSVMSQNLFMGTDFPELTAARSLPEFIQAVTITYQNVLATRPAERMATIAKEITNLQPDFVGLQEAAILRTGAAPPATTVEFDMLQILLKELAKRGQHYAAVAILPGLDAEAPSTLGFEVRFTVQDVILARADQSGPDFKLSNVQVRQYLSQLTVPTAIGPITNPAGWASVDVQSRGKKFRFVTTHLAIAPNFDPTIPGAQAGELIATAGNTKLPVVFVGDFNSTASDPTNPTFSTYRRILDAGFHDVWSEIHPSAPGFTCCQSPDVRNTKSLLSQRIDLVFSRGPIEANDAQLVGTRAVDRTPSGLWPSDHAGVMATLNLDRD